MPATTGVPGAPAFGALGGTTYSPTQFPTQAGVPDSFAVGVEFNRPAGLDLRRLAGVSAAAKR